MNQVSSWQILLKYAKNNNLDAKCSKMAIFPHWIIDYGTLCIIRYTIPFQRQGVCHNISESKVLWAHIQRCNKTFA